MDLFLVLALLLTCAHKSLAELWAALVSLLLRMETIMSLILHATLFISLTFVTSSPSVSFVLKES